MEIYMNRSRYERLCNNMQKKGLDRLLITDPLSIKWLCGYYTNPMERFLGLLISPGKDSVLLVNRLFEAPELRSETTEATATTAPSQAPQIQVLSFGDEDDPAEMLASLLTPEHSADKNTDRTHPSGLEGRQAPTICLGVDGSLPARRLLPLMERGIAGRFVLGSAAVDEVRSIKDNREQELLRMSSQSNDAAMAWLVQQVAPGVSELNIARRLEEEYLRLGAEGFSFTPIVSFGAHGADPHHEPDHTEFCPGDVVLFDVGCLQGGYCSDMTRTFFTAPPSRLEQEVYETVLRAQTAAEALVRPGVLFSEIDGCARRIIEEAGFGSYFTHRLGHQVGMGIHEPGDVSGVHHEAVQPGQCFSIEPGIYLPGKLGVRIEDLVIVTPEGCEVLNHYPKELTVLAV